MVARNVDVGELQEWCFILGDSPRYRRNPEDTWFMLQRARLAMQDEQTGGMLGGDVEVDETFIGGKARNMHKDKRAEKITGRGPSRKAIVAAVLERGGKVRAKVVGTRREADLQKLVRET